MPDSKENLAQFYDLARGPSGVDERMMPEVADRANLLYSLKRYHFAQPYCSGKTVLDVGSGAGYGADILAQTANAVFAVDYDYRIVKHASTRYPSPRFITADVTALPFRDQTIDVVVSFEVVEHLYDQPRYLDEVRRVLRPEGVFIVSTSNIEVTQKRERITGVKVDAHVGEMGPRQFKTLLRKFFSVDEFWGMRLKGSTLYSMLRSLDIFNLRLHLIRWRRAIQVREKFLGTEVMGELSEDGIVLSRRQLRQASHFLAVNRHKIAS
jgi:ubiquinone/menaquinone biosynthesis C-methylase UbiE